MGQDSNILSGGFGGATHIFNISMVQTQLAQCGASLGKLERFLDDERLVLWVVAQETFMTHPKIIAFPLGLDYPLWAYDYLHKHLHTLKKTRLLSFAGDPNRGYRSAILKWVTKRCSVTVRGGLHLTQYWKFVAQSKFILSPPGTGYDCFRHWETIYYGSIPVIEHSTMDRSFAGLPVLLVDSYADLTPEFLEEKWQNMTCNPHQYDFRRLTIQYWVHLLKTVLNEASNRIVQNNHPIDLRYAGCFEVRTDWVRHNLADSGRPD